MKLPSIAAPVMMKIAAVVGGLMLITIGMLSWQLSSARSTINDQNVRIGGLERDIQHQNAAVQRQRDLADAAQARADAAVAEALRVNDRQQPVIVSLRESAARGRNPSEPCVISDTLRSAEGL